MVAYADIGSRIIAGIVDFVITLAISLVIFLFLVPVSFGSVSTLWCLLSSPLLLNLFGLLSTVLFAYYTCFEGSCGQSPGKRFMRIKVVSEDGSKCSLGQVLVRNILRIADFLPAFYILGLTSIIITRNRKRLGDILARTIVVRA